VDTQTKKPTVRTIPATEARIHFGEVLKRVYRGEEHLIVEKDGLPIAAILSHTEYENYRRLLASEQLDELNRKVNRGLREQGITEEDALVGHQESKKEAFAERYGRAKPTRRKSH
jgi:prevent-host-death family protein